MKFIIQAWSYLFAFVLFTAMVLTLHFWPPSNWMDVKLLSIQNSSVGQPILISVDRVIKKQFHASWNVTIRQWDGGWVTFCNATGESNYKLDSKFPKNLDLKWWTANACHPLPVGRYHITTSWRVDGFGIFPDKEIVIHSNVFEVKL